MPPSSILGQGARGAISATQGTFADKTLRDKNKHSRCAMKTMLLVVFLIGPFLVSEGQQQWCFSKNCPQTPATFFKLDRSRPELWNVFRRPPALPAMKPLAPLMFSPTTSQLFLYTKPSSKIAFPFGLHTDTGSLNAVRSSAGKTSNANGAARGNGSPQ